jgi:hypothetical protein
MTTALSNPFDIIHLASDLFPLSFLTIASGTKNTPSIIHSLSVGETNGEEFILGLTGTTTRPTAITFNNPHQLFKTETSSAPSLEYFRSIQNFESARFPRSNDLERVIISNSIALPPTTADIIMSLDDLSAGNIFEHVLRHCLARDHSENAPLMPTADNKTTGATQPAMLETAKHLPLLQHLYAFARMKSPRTSGFQIANSDRADSLLTFLEKQLTAGQI